MSRFFARSKFSMFQRRLSAVRQNFLRILLTNFEIARDSNLSRRLDVFATMLYAEKFLLKE